jgi:hypothetical protein
VTGVTLDRIITDSRDAYPRAIRVPTSSDLIGARGDRTLLLARFVQS